MKNIFKYAFVLGCFLGAQNAGADVMKDFDGLGENKELFDKAKALHPEMSVVVVQDRVVDRRNRLEIAPEMVAVSGGDSYINTYGYGLSAHYHVSPWWSVGARYSYYTNKLTKEAENLINDTSATGSGIIPEIDHPENAIMGFVNVYPIYGKMSTLNIGITHFDMYLTAGYGQIALKSGSVGTWAGGLGVGFWFSQHLTTRLEVRYQNYEATRYNGKDGMNTINTSLQLGYIL